jgi:hypothetical protein
VAGFARVEAMIDDGRYPEAASLLEGLTALEGDHTVRAARLTWQGVIAYRQEQYERARGYLSEAQRVLGEPFRDLLSAARIAHYRGLLSERAGEPADCAEWLQRASELIRCARLAAPRVTDKKTASGAAPPDAISRELVRIHRTMQRLTPGRKPVCQREHIHES